MNILPITNQLRSNIYKSARKKVGGASPLFECGIRTTPGGVQTPNSLFWDHDESNDLDFIKLSDLKSVEVTTDGECELDLYATTGKGWQRQLETNVYVRFNSAGIVSVEVT